MRAERSYINLSGSEALAEDKELEEDLTREDFEDEVTKFSNLYADLEEKKDSDVLDDIIIFAGLFAIVASILGVFVLAVKAIHRILK